MSWSGSLPAATDARFRDPAATAIRVPELSDETAWRRLIADPYRQDPDSLDAAQTLRSVELLWGSADTGARRSLTDTSTDEELLSAQMREAGFDDAYALTPVGGSVRVTPGFGGGPVMVNGISVDRRADAAFQAADDLLGMGQMYRDYKLLGALTVDAQQKAIIDRMKESLRTRLGGVRPVPTEAALGAITVIDARGLVRYDKADLIDRYGDALRKVEMWQRGFIELDTRTMTIVSIGNQRMSPAQWVDENMQRYQRAFAAGLEDARQRLAKGALPFKTDMPEQLKVSLWAQRVAERAIIRFNDALGLPEGPGQLLAMNRWSYDPSGTGMTVRPDMLLDLGPDRRFIVDGKSTLTQALASGSQLGRMRDWLGGAPVTVAVPEGLRSWLPRKGR